MRSFVTILASIAATEARNCKKDITLIMEAEGKHPCVYTNDVDGHRNVCYGYDLENDVAPRELLSVSAEFQDVISGDECLDETQCNILLYQNAGS